MKRFHVHAHVDDLQASIAFYSKLFAAEPARVEADYAKWMIEDPRINFAISTRGDKPGVDHLGFQTDTEEELTELKARALRELRIPTDGLGARAGTSWAGRTRRPWTSSSPCVTRPPAKCVRSGQGSP